MAGWTQVENSSGRRHQVQASLTGGGDNWSCAKLQSNHYQQQTNTLLFIGQMSFLSPNEQCQSTKGIFNNKFNNV